MGTSVAFSKQTPNQNQKPRKFSSVVFLLLFFFLQKTNFHVVNKAGSTLYSSFALRFHVSGKLYRIFSEYQENSVFIDEIELLPLQSCWQIVRKKSLFTVFPLFHTNSNEKSIFLNSQPAPVSLPSNVLSTTYLRSFEPMFKMYTIYKWSVQFCIPNQSAGEAFWSAVMCWDSELEQVDKVLGW